MESPRNDDLKLATMVMCGDHPSFTKSELNAKEQKPEDEVTREPVKAPMSYGRISPSTSKTERGASGVLVRPSSPHTLRALEARRRVRSLEEVRGTDPTAVSAAGNRALVQAALGSFRWPPYLLCVWVLVLVVTHALHCLVSVLERALPALKKFCQYFKSWSEESWRADGEANRRVCPVALAFLTGWLYTLYFGLYLLYSVALWSIEPLCTELEESKSSTEMVEPRVTNYIDDLTSKSNASVKR